MFSSKYQAPVQARRTRPVIAFFDYPDVFEDFYPHYGVDQHSFATQFTDGGNHAFLELLQREIGDVVWYAFSVAPQLTEACHERIGCKVRMFPSSGLHRRLWRFFWLSPFSWRLYPIYPLFALLASYSALGSRAFLRALRRDRPDFIFVQDYATGRFDVLLLMARLLGIPLIARHAGSHPEDYVGHLVKHWTIRNADRLIVSSHEELDMLARHYRVPVRRLEVILTPVDTTTLCPMDRVVACKTAGLDPSRRHLLFVGRLVDHIKRVSAIIQSFAGLATRYSDVDLLIAGTGDDREKLKKLADEIAPGRVRFLGWVSDPPALRALFNAAECLLLPSTREGFPCVIAEAMACGAPVLGSAVGGVPEMVVEGETGWLVPPGDDAALRDRMAFVLDNREAVAALRPHARRMAEQRVSPARVIAALHDCFTNSRNTGRCNGLTTCANKSCS
jgi:glycosyltransferase involved in cell wall biosynthesis